MIFTAFEFTENVTSSNWLASGTLPVLTLAGVIEAGPGFDITLPLLTIESTAVTGEVATVAESLPVLTLEATAQQDPYVFATLPALTGDAYMTTGITVDEAIPDFDCESTCIVGEMFSFAQAIPALTIEAETGASADAEIPPLTLEVQMQVGQLGRMSLELPAITLEAVASASLNPGEPLVGALVLPAITLEAVASASLNPGEPLVGSLALPLPTLEAAAVQTEIYSVAAVLPVLAISAQMEGGTTTEVDLTLPLATLAAEALSGNVYTLTEALPLLEAEAQHSVDATYTLSETLPALQLLAEAIQTISDAVATAAGSPAQAWVLNLRNEALTEYTNWAFNSMAYFNGKYIGASDAGIFELGVQDNMDGTTNIPARARTGKHDSESSFLKRMPYGYLECEAGGDVVVSTLTSEDDQRDYLVPWNGNAAIQNRRINFGRGPKSKHWQFEFANRNGSHFRIVALDSMPRRSHRRVQ